MGLRREPTIKRVPFLIPSTADAQVLTPNTILLKRSTPASNHLIAHELGHIDQIRRMGRFRYWSRYLWLLSRHGYENHPMEIEAEQSAGSRRQQERAARIIARERSRA